MMCWTKVDTVNVLLGCCECICQIMPLWDHNGFGCISFNSSIRGGGGSIVQQTHFRMVISFAFDIM